MIWSSQSQVSRLLNRFMYIHTFLFKNIPRSWLCSNLSNFELTISSRYLSSLSQRKRIAFENLNCVLFYWKLKRIVDFALYLDRDFLQKKIRVYSECKKEKHNTKKREEQKIYIRRFLFEFFFFFFLLLFFCIQNFFIDTFL